MGKDSRDASGYVRPAWEDVMREVNARPLNRDKVAFLREVVEQDDAFVRRHGVDDAESLRKKMSEAYVRGQLRASQVPSWADRGAGVGDNSTRRPTLPHVGVEDLPPWSEIEAYLKRCGTRDERCNYLETLLSKHDHFQRSQEEMGELDVLYSDGYIELVRRLEAELEKQRQSGSTEEAAGRQGDNGQTSPPANYRRPEWDVVLKHVQSAGDPCERENYLRNVLAADKQFVLRHGYEDRGALRLRAVEAVESGTLGYDDVPLDLLEGNSGQAGYPKIIASVEDGFPPSVGEVLHFLGSLHTEGEKRDYLRALRDNMDLYETRFAGQPGIWSEKVPPHYMKLVHVVNTESRKIETALAETARRAEEVKTQAFQDEIAEWKSQARKKLDAIEHPLDRLEYIAIAQKGRYIQVDLDLKATIEHTRFSNDTVSEEKRNAIAHIYSEMKAAASPTEKLAYLRGIQLRLSLAEDSEEIVGEVMQKLNRMIEHIENTPNPAPDLSPAVLTTVSEPGENPTRANALHLARAAFIFARNPAISSKAEFEQAAQDLQAEIGPPGNSPGEAVWKGVQRFMRSQFGLVPVHYQRIDGIRRFVFEALQEVASEKDNET